MEKIFIDHHLLFFYNPPQSPFFKGGQRGIKGEKKDLPLLTRNSIINKAEKTYTPHPTLSHERRGN
jgi:hypothetical protein